MGAEIPVCDINNVVETIMGGLVFMTIIICITIVVNKMKW